MSAFSGSWADIDAAKQGGGLAHSDRGGGSFHDPVIEWYKAPVAELWSREEVLRS